MASLSALIEIARVIGYLKRAEVRFRLIFFTVAASIVLLLIHLYLILLLFPLVNGIISGDFTSVGQLTLVGDLLRLIPGWTESSQSQLFILTTWICFVALLRSLAAYKISLMIREEASLAMSQVRATLLRRFQMFGRRYFERNGSSDLVDQFVGGAGWIGTLAVGFQQLVTDVLLVALYLGVAFFISWQLTLTLFLVALPLVSLSGKIRTRLAQSSVESTQVSQKLHGSALDFFRSMSVFKAMGRLKVEAERLLHVSDQEVLQRERAFQSHQLLNPLHEVSVTFAHLFIGWAIAFLYWPGEKNVAELFVFFFLVTRIVPLFNSIGRFRASVASQAGLIRLFEALFQDEGKFIFTFGQREFPAELKSVEVRGLSFAYDHGVEVLREIHLELKQGEVTFVSGKIGSGKTTLARLLSRQERPDRGQLRINGLDFEEFSQESWARAVAFVEQQPTLLNATIRENICSGQGDPADGVYLSELLQALQIRPWLDKLPQGLETRLGPGGTHLSGGQAQQIALARALFSKPQLLLLDEPTSAMDAETAQAALQGVRKMSQATLLVISHQPMARAFADRVFLLADGRLVPGPEGAEGTS